MAIRSRLSPIERPAVMFLPLGIAIGPRGLNLLPESFLSYLDPAVAGALAALGVLVGLRLQTGWFRPRALLGTVGLETGLTALIVTTGALVIPALSTRLGATPWMPALLLGVCGSASSAAVHDSTSPSSSLSARVVEIDGVLTILLGGLALLWLQQPSPGAALLLAAEVTAIAVIIAVAGWILVGQTVDDNEQRVFAAGTLLLLGGAAEYVGASALFAGLIAGACWRIADGAARDRLTRDMRYLQHPLIALLLLIAGARCHFSLEVAALLAGYVMCRTVGKLAGGWMVGRLVGGDRPRDLSLELLAPGALGIAFAMNTMMTWNQPVVAALLLDVVVLGSLLSACLALAHQSRPTA